MRISLPERLRSGFTLIEVLVVIGIIALLLGFLLPALEKAREKANNLNCAVNLNQIGMALLIYSNDHHGQYPRTIYDPAAPLAFGTNPAAADPFGPGGPQPNDVTAAMFLLLRPGNMPAKIFNEPYGDELENTPDPAPDFSARSNFTEYQKNLGYSYANPYPNLGAVQAGYSLTSKIKGAFVMAADRNPGVAGENSKNHEARGQNVLYADGHVEWQTTTQCGMNSDDIYANKAGVIQASPVDATDSVLLPID